MTTIAAAHKGKTIALASDSLISSNRQKLSARYLRSHSKIFSFADNYIASSGSCSWDMAIPHYLKNLKEMPKLRNELEIYNFTLTMIKVLEEHNYLNSDDDDGDIDFKDMKLWAVLVNCHGMFTIENGRSVIGRRRLCALGAGEEYAMGAMYALYDTDADAAAIARAGVRAGCEFDKSSEPPIHVKTIVLV
ncbi:MAG: MFS transporter [Actinomycetes bacterium]|jgi:ATP-dependent protease HslVU (ClpYQ) peptidase subunit|nr:MFS transporter [Actinomycetes bacterium]